MNFAQARSAMVESQIHTAGVVTPAVLDAFRAVPREAFVPPHLAGVAYVDENLSLGDGRVLPEPAVLARMVEALNIDRNDVVLNVGDGTGYVAAVLSLLSGHVMTVETYAGQFDFARPVWESNGYANMSVIDPSIANDGPYSVIVVNGAVAEIPSVFLEQLTIGGRMAAVVKPVETSAGRAVIVQRVAEDKYSTVEAFDASVPYLPGFEPRRGFVF